MDPVSEVDDLSLTRLTQRIRVGGVIAGVLATLIPPTVALMLQAGQASPRDVLSLAIPLALAGIAWLQPRWSVRVLLSTMGVYAYLVAVVLLDTAASIEWPPVASSTFAASVVVISGTRGLWGLLGIGASAALCAAGVLVEPISTFNISVDFLGGWITPLVSIALGMSFFIVLRVWDRRSKEFDDYLESIRIEHRLALEESETAVARRQVDRRIHETVLNTLNAITVSEDSDTIREHCRMDLDTLTDAGVAVPPLLSAIIAEAAARVTEIDTHVDVLADEEINDEQVRTTLADAVTELLRNVERHSGEQAALIRADVTSQGPRITVEDRGRGITAGDPARFGRRYTLAAAIHEIGGTISWSAVDPHGTRVQIDVPIPTRTAPPLMPASFDILLESLTVRVALVPTLWIGLLAVPVAAFSFALPWAIIISFLLLGSSTAAVIALWSTAHRRTLSLITLGALLITVGIAATGQDGCTSAIPFHWVIFAAAGTLALLALAQSNAISRIVVTMTGLVVTTLLAFTAPATCRLDPVDAALENAAWVVIIVSVITSLSSQVDRYRIAADRQWRNAVQLRAKSLATQGAAERWATARASVDGLLHGIAAGSIDPIDPATRLLARSTQTRLRSMLEIGQLRDPLARKAWEEFLASIDGEELALRVEVLDEQHVPLSPASFEALRSLVRAVNGAPVTVSLMAGTLLVQSTSALPQYLFARQWALLDVDAERGWTLEFAPEQAKASG